MLLRTGILSGACLINRTRQKKRFFSQVRILKDFKSNDLQVRITKELRTHFSDLRILKGLGVKTG